MTLTSIGLRTPDGEVVRVSLECFLLTLDDLVVLEEEDGTMTGLEGFELGPGASLHRLCSNHGAEDLLGDIPKLDVVFVEEDDDTGGLAVAVGDLARGRGEVVSRGNRPTPRGRTHNDDGACFTAWLTISTTRSSGITTSFEIW